MPARRRGFLLAIPNLAITMAVSNSPRGWVVVGVVLAALWTRTLALEVTSGSPCKSVCNGDYKGGFTFEGDLVCSDSQYNTTSEGNTMKSCLLCESTSTTYDNETENDLLWFLCMDQPLSYNSVISATNPVYSQPEVHYPALSISRVRPDIMRRSMRPSPINAVEIMVPR